jgi:type IV secretion system protein VirB9
MKNKYILLITLLITASGYAADMPQSSNYDNRIQHVNYNDGDVVIIRALPGLGARVVFDKSETILDAASGFSKGWEFKNRRNILYIKPKSILLGRGANAAVEKPKAGKWNTNLMVTTDKRLYDFDLILLRSSSRSGNVPKSKEVAYRVVFHYPNEVVKKETLKRRDEILKALLETAPIPKNWNYSMGIGKDSERIVPKSAYDDGRFTYFRFPGNREIPAVFVVAEDGNESIVNTHVQNSEEGEKDELVIQRIAKQFNLRLGNSVVAVFNESYDADGLPPKEGTTVGGLKREVKGEQ